MSPFKGVDVRKEPEQQFGRITVQYVICKVDRSLAVVCAATFQSITGPATDRCSACLLFEKQLANPDANNFEEINSQFKLHKLKAAKFHSLMRESKDKCDTLTIVFDLQQNQPIPKTGINVLSTSNLVLQLDIRHP